MGLPLAWEEWSTLAKIVSHLFKKSVHFIYSCVCVMYTSVCLGGWVCSGCTCPTVGMWDQRTVVKGSDLSLSYSVPMHPSHSPPSLRFHKTVFVSVLGSIGSNSSFVIPVSPTLLVRVSNVNPLTPRNILSLFYYRTSGVLPKFSTSF